jgi:hypothetical protein
MADSNSFWMYRWMDERGISKPADASRVLSRPRGLRSLQDFVESCPTELEPLDDPLSAIAAGRSMDLTGMLECSHWACLTQKIDGLFRDTWHYFDAIVVEGPSASRIQRLFWGSQESTAEQKSARLTDYATALLKLREQGLDRYLIFREKPQECTVHFEQHVHEAGLERLSKSKVEIVDQLVADGRLEDRPRQCTDHWHFRYRHPSLAVPVTGRVDGTWSREGTERRQRLAAEEVFRSLLANLSADIRNASELGVPLAAGLELHEDLLRRKAEPVHVEDVAMRLRLPVMQNMTAAEVLAFRESEDISFERMRSAIRTAIEERLKTESDPEVAAEKIYRNVIEPEINDIDAKLKGARRGLSSKTALSLSVGAVTTTVGIISALPPVVAVGLALGAGSVLHGTKYIDDKTQVELSDMYFLWHAERHSHAAARRTGEKGLRKGRRS